MAKFTNHTAGLRGINLAEGTRWLEPGETVEIDKKDIIGELPDLGKPSDAASDDDADLIASVQAENAALKEQVAAHVKTIADRDAEIAKLKTPAK